MAIRLIALDIDGTLTNQPDQVSERNIAAVRRAEAAGISVILATGRALTATRAIWRNIDLHGPCILYGGAMIVDIDSERVLKMHELSPDVIREVLEYSVQQGVHAQIYVDDTVIYEKKSSLAEIYVGRHHLNHTIDPDIRKKDWHRVPKVLCLCDSERQDELFSSYRRRFQDIAQVSRSNPGYIEINSLGVTKGSALEEVSQLLGIPQRQVAAAGDNYLDLEMIEWAGIGACVADGAKDVLSKADMIIPPCAEDGVAVWIEEYILTES